MVYICNVGRFDDYYGPPMRGMGGPPMPLMRGGMGRRGPPQG